MFEDEVDGKKIALVSVDQAECLVHVHNVVMLEVSDDAYLSKSGATLQVCVCV